jgi:hypothetical protein
MNENAQVLLAWVVHHPCDGMDGKSQIQSEVRVDPCKHARKLQVLGLDVWKNTGGQSALGGREERGLASVPVRGCSCSGRMLKRLKFFIR